MEYRPIEVNVICAYDLKDVNVISTMDVYVICSVSGDPRSTQKTPIDKGGGTNPKWNYRMKFAFDEPAARLNRLGLVFQITSDRTLGDKEIGRVYVSLKELLDAGKDGKSGDISGDEKRVTYQVQTPIGKFKGYLEFNYKFGEKFCYSVDRGFDKPILAYPPGSDLSQAGPGLYMGQNGRGLSQTGPHQVQQEQGSYLVQSGPGSYLSQPVPANPPSGYGHGYPSQGQGYGYSGQAPGGYGYENKGQVPSGYGYPNQGQGPNGYGYPGQSQGADRYGYSVHGSNVYGYPGQGSSGNGQRPKTKKGSKIGTGAMAGVGVGLLGGLLVGEMVEDVAEIATYDEMDVGGGMFGF